MITGKDLSFTRSIRKSTDALLQNLTLLLSDESSGESSTVVDFPTQQEMIASVGDNVNFAPIQNQPDAITLPPTLSYGLGGR